MILVCMGATADDGLYGADGDHGLYGGGDVWSVWLSISIMAILSAAVSL